MIPYIDPRPKTALGKLRTALMYLLDDHRLDGTVPTSVRFCFYELVAKGIIAKSGDRPDKIVSQALTDLRERGLVPWEWIVDETRSVEDYTGSLTVAIDLLLYLKRCAHRSVARQHPVHHHRVAVAGRRVARDVPRVPRPHRANQWPSRRLPAHRCGAAAQAG